MYEPWLYTEYNFSAYGSLRRSLSLTCQVCKMLRFIAVEQSIFHCWFTAQSVVVGIIFTEWIREKVIVNSSTERGGRLQTGWKSSLGLRASNWPEYVFGQMPEWKQN